MHCSSILLGLAVCLLKTFAYSIPSTHPNATVSATFSLSDGMMQAEALTAYLIDNKEYDRFGEVFTEDCIYDSTSLGAYGGLSVGLEQIKTNLAAAIGDALVEHIVTNLVFKEILSSTKVHVNTYITYSHWDKSDLYDITKTFRIYYQCDDIWVYEDGVWKLQYSYVTNTGPKVEAPYFGKQ